MDKNNFSNNLHFLRKQHGMTLEELGKQINVTKQTISRYEKGLIEPSFHSLVSLSKLFNCSLDTLVFENIESNSDINVFSINKLIKKEFPKIEDLIEKEFPKIEKVFYKKIESKLNELLKNIIKDNYFNSEILDLKSQILDLIKDEFIKNINSKNKY